MRTPVADIDEKLGVGIDAARRGSGAGFTEIYRVIAGKVAGYLRGRGVTDYEDVTNEVFLAAFASFESFVGGPSEFRSWLFVIAWNKSSDWHRAAARRPQTVCASTSESVIGQMPGGDGEADAIAGLGSADVDHLLATLTDDQRDVITPRIIADLSLEQTAHALGKPISAVKALQHRALARLQKEVPEISRAPVSREPAAANTGAR